MSHYVKTNEPTWKGIYFHLVERDDDGTEKNLFKASLFLCGEDTAKAQF